MPPLAVTALALLLSSAPVLIEAFDRVAPGSLRWDEPLSRGAGRARRR